MMLKEYRICMPLTVEEYKVGQLYMIAKHSDEQSSNGEGVEVVKNEPCQHEVHGAGQFTEKRIYISNRLPGWIQTMLSKICSFFYVTEKAWNYYPHTFTEYTCSFVPKFSIEIETKYENNSGTTDNCLGYSEEDLLQREVLPLDIAFDEISEKHYKENEDPTKFKSAKTGRGPLTAGWRENTKPIMCSYKGTKVRFDVWGLRSRVEDFVHRSIQEILILGHRQAFTWIDEWIDLTIEDVRDFEQKQQEKTNKKVSAGLEGTDSTESAQEISAGDAIDPAMLSTGATDVEKVES
ncbi:cytoplasmic phosphatidylinositol transfer protein 1-like [Antedon mediterranea]|uniref:cytoplasmic phosphatidylinositol transfer protein 1-like n=1 Tax=Antedon mediterranea TaxID=105859 RepID=UPI003AF9FF66